MHNRQHPIQPPHNNHQTAQPTPALIASLLPIAEVRATDARTPVVVCPANVNPDDGVIVGTESYGSPAVGAEARDSRSPQDGVR